MYISIRDETLMAARFASITAGLNHCGLRSVEMQVERDYTMRAIAPTEDRPRLRTDSGDDVKRLQEQAAAAGVRLSALLLPNNFNAPDIDAELDWVVRVVEVAAQLGIPAVRIDAIMHGGGDIPREQREAIFTRCMGVVLSRTEGLPVDLGIENHGTQGNDPAFLEGLFRAVGSPRLGLTMDTGNFYWAGYPLSEVYAILERLAPHTKHAHVKNIRYPEEIRETRREAGYAYGKYVSPIPEGDIDVRKVIGFLRSAGYDRDLCIEDESLGKYSPEEGQANLRAAAEFLCVAAGAQ